MKLSVITATYNVIEHLPNLIQSLREQTDKDFEWVVADGASTDGTLELLESIDDLNIVITSQEDFGIYDALNRGIKISKGEFYLVMGADDILYPEAIEKYKAEISDDVDLVTARVQRDNGSVSPVPTGKSWFRGMRAHITNHSVGVIIKKNLHKKYGYYTNKLPIVADMLFIKQICNQNASIKNIDYIAGKFGTSGVSNIDVAGALSEDFRVQLLTEKNKPLQLILFILRLIKNINRL